MLQVFRNLLLTKYPLGFLLLRELPHREFAVVVFFEVGNNKEPCVSKLDGDGGHEQDEDDDSHDDDYQGQDSIQYLFYSWGHTADKQDVIDPVAPDLVYDISMLV